MNRLPAPCDDLTDPRSRDQKRDSAAPLVLLMTFSPLVVDEGRSPFFLPSVCAFAALVPQPKPAEFVDLKEFLDPGEGFPG